MRRIRRVELECLLNATNRLRRGVQPGLGIREQNERGHMPRVRLERQFRSCRCRLDSRPSRRMVPARICASTFDASRSPARAGTEYAFTKSPIS